MLPTSTLVYEDKMIYEVFFNMYIFQLTGPWSCAQTSLATFRQEKVTIQGAQNHL